MDKQDKPKIIFLDIDGVLNCRPDNIKEKWPDIKAMDERLIGLSDDLVKNLKKVIDETGAKIVVSSSWRHFNDYFVIDPDKNWRMVLAEKLGRKAEDLFIGDTPSKMTLELYLCGIGEYFLRGAEILGWMKSKENVEKYGEPGDGYAYCIIDDEVTDILRHHDARHVLHTDYRTGLTADDADKVIHILETSFE